MLAIQEETILEGMENMGDRIKKLMDEKGFSYRTLGKRISRNHMTVYGWVHGASIKDYDLERLARALGVTVDELRYGPDGPPPPQVDGELLAEILTAVEVEATSLGITLTPDKRSEAVTTLYGLFIRSHHVDRTIVHRIVRLAA